MLVYIACEFYDNTQTLLGSAYSDTNSWDEARLVLWREMQRADSQGHRLVWAMDDSFNEHEDGVHVPAALVP